MKVCFLKFKFELLYIYIFNHFCFDRSFFSNIILYFKRFTNFSFILHRFALGIRQLNYLLEVNGFRSIKIIFFDKIKFISNFMLLLFLKKQTNRFFLQWFKKTAKEFLLLDINYVIFITTFLFFLSPIRKPVFSFAYFRKKFGVIKFKLISIVLENVIYKTTTKVLFVSLSNILLIPNGLRIPLIGLHYLKDVNFRFQFFTLIISLYYTNTLILAEAISNLLKISGKQHIKKIKAFISFFEHVCSLTFIRCLGFQLRISGKLGGVLRATKFHYKYGNIRLQTFFNDFSFICLHSFTKFGVFSVKI